MLVNCPTPEEVVYNHTQTKEEAMTQNFEGAHSPKIPVVRVGVTGHRTEGLRRAQYHVESLPIPVREVLRQLRAAIIEILAEDPSLYGFGVPTFRVVSPLAEGADRIIAEQALSLGYELESPLPFSQAEYENDFSTEESRTQFRHLLGHACAVIELEGERNTAELAYETVGRWVLKRSNIIITLWDGGAPAGRGGTGQILKESLELKIPTIWITPDETACRLKSIAPLACEPIEWGSREVGHDLVSSFRENVIDKQRLPGWKGI